MAQGGTLLMEHDRVVPGPDGYVRVERVVLPDAAVTGLRDARIMILRSAVSGSASEMLAFVIGRTGRGEVIGETTAGRADASRWLQLGYGLRVLIPHAGTRDPATGIGWEGKGVAPTGAVPVESALSEALVRSGVDRVKAEALSSPVGPDPAMLRPAPRAPE